MRLLSRPGADLAALTVLLAVLLALLAACGSDAASSSEEASSSEDPTAAATPTASPTATPTEAPTEVPTEAPTETPTATPEPTPTEPPPGFIEVEYANGGVVGGVGRAKLPTGETVELHVVADVTDHVHVHGYDIFGDVAAGAPAVLTFEANIPGVWEVELEGLGQLLVELEVN